MLSIGRVSDIDGNGIDRLKSIPNSGSFSENIGNLMIGRLSDIDGSGIDRLRSIPNSGSFSENIGSLMTGRFSDSAGNVTENGIENLHKLIYAITQ